MLDGWISRGLGKGKVRDQNMATGKAEALREKYTSKSNFRNVKSPPFFDSFYTVVKQF